MRFMNMWEIEDVYERYRKHQLLGPAVQTLLNLATWANENSDGWHSWPKPARAAAKLMDLIEGPEPRQQYDDERSDVTLAKLRAALAPVKAFRTRMDADFTIVESLSDVPAEAPPERVLTGTILTALIDISEACVHGYRVVRVLPDDRVIEGTARSLGDERGNFMHHDDVRDKYMRVTTMIGEMFWPVSELIPQVLTGTFFVRRHQKESD